VWLVSWSASVSASSLTREPAVRDRRPQIAKVMADTLSVAFAGRRDRADARRHYQYRSVRRYARAGVALSRHTARRSAVRRQAAAPGPGCFNRICSRPPHNRPDPHDAHRVARGHFGDDALAGAALRRALVENGRSSSRGECARRQCPLEAPTDSESCALEVRGGSHGRRGISLLDSIPQPPRLRSTGRALADPPRCVAAQCVAETNRFRVGSPPT